MTACLVTENNLITSSAWLNRVMFDGAADDNARIQARHIYSVIVAFRSGEWKLTGKRPAVPIQAANWIDACARRHEVAAMTIIQFLRHEMLMPYETRYSITPGGPDDGEEKNFRESNRSI